ncbi:extracellular solute-binding protein [Halovenus rubra]|uniref:Extracellular solute-binding protein n=2 Tax=Halovenus rubra TaxID=869890 RepID=A0ABD5XA71_9EURY|nr:extracellular solute-binding protein [Halovenus rubra]
MTSQNPDDGHDRRRFIAGLTALGATSLAGCTDLLGDDSNDENNDSEESSDGEDNSNGSDGTDSDIGQIGSGRAGRDAPGGMSMEELPDLSGELTVYSGRGEFLVGPLVNYIENLYDDFELTPRYADSTDHVNAILNEGQGTPADVFYSVNSGSLGALADEGRTQALPSEVVDMVPDEFHTEQWTGTSGRARTVPYNTDAYAEEDLPDSIMAYPDFEGDLGWAPSYGSCQAFVTAMRILEGEEATSEWVEGIIDGGVQTYPNEFAASQAVADGEIDAAFTNHYYIQRVLDSNPNASIATSFTSGDAGSVFNVAGATIIDAADNADLAAKFIRHLLSAEAQEFFAVETFEYPLNPNVEPVGDLPTTDELDVPELDLSELSDLEATVDLLREAGANV